MRRIMVTLLGTLMLVFGITVGTAVAAQAQMQTQVCPAYPAADYSFNDNCPQSLYKPDLYNAKPNVEGLLNDDYMNQNSIIDLQNQVDKLEQGESAAITFAFVFVLIALAFAFIMVAMWFHLRSEMRAIVGSIKSTSSGE